MKMKKIYIIQENAKGLSRKMNWWCWKKQVGSQLEGKKNTHTCTCTKKRKRIEGQGVGKHQRNRNRKADNDSKCDTYITRGP